MGGFSSSQTVSHKQRDQLAELKARSDFSLPAGKWWHRWCHPDKGLAVRCGSSNTEMDRSWSVPFASSHPRYVCVCLKSIYLSVLLFTDWIYTHRRLYQLYVTDSFNACIHCGFWRLWWVKWGWDPPLDMRPVSVVHISVNWLDPRACSRPEDYIYHRKWCGKYRRTHWWTGPKKSQLARFMDPPTGAVGVILCFLFSW